jgi:PTS system nitrogen regulatory IIA component
MDENEIMSVAEVANLLRVAERTVYDWADKGVIPCARFGGSLRFRRSQVIARFEEQTPKAPEKIHMRDVLAPQRVLFSQATDKHAVMNELVREELMSTGIGLGIGLPHVRNECVKRPVIAIARCNPLHDYDSIDGDPVTVVVMIAVSRGQHSTHLQLLSEVSVRLRDQRLREQLQTASDAAEFARLLTDPHGPAED